MNEHNITIYMKDGCHLCTDALEMLEGFDGVYGRLNVSEVEITSDAALFERYKYVIPVIEIDERVHLEAPIHAADLRAAFEALR